MSFFCSFSWFWELLEVTFLTSDNFQKSCKNANQQGFFKQKQDTPLV